MVSHLSWMALLLLADGPRVPAEAGDTTRCAEVQPTTPLYSVCPWDEGVFLTIGSTSGRFARSWCGLRWRFRDGSTISGWWERGIKAIGFAYRKYLHETENFRCSVFGGTRSGIDLEWYLGNEFTARLKLGCSLFPFRAGICQVGVDWYSLEGVFSTTLAPLHGGWGWNGTLPLDLNLGPFLFALGRWMEMNN